MNQSDWAWLDVVISLPEPLRNRSLTPRPDRPRGVQVALPWKTLEKVATREGVLELRQRGPTEFHITLNGLVLMNSSARRSEEALGQLACEGLAMHPAPRVVVAGLGLGFTLKAMLGVLPPTAAVTVAELNQVVVDWCRGPLSSLTDGAVADSRVSVEVTDVNQVIRRAAANEAAPVRCAGTRPLRGASCAKR